MHSSSRESRGKNDSLTTDKVGDEIFWEKNQSVIRNKEVQSTNKQKIAIKINSQNSELIIITAVNTLNTLYSNA